MRRGQILQCSGLLPRCDVLSFGQGQEEPERSVPIQNDSERPKDLPTGLRQAEREESHPQGPSPEGRHDSHPPKAGGRKS